MLLFMTNIVIFIQHKVHESKTTNINIYIVPYSIISTHKLMNSIEHHEELLGRITVLLIFS